MDIQTFYEESVSEARENRVVPQTARPVETSAIEEMAD